MNVRKTIALIRTALVKPPVWEQDEGFRGVVYDHTRQGLFAAGLLAAAGTVVYLFVNLVALEKTPSLVFEAAGGSKSTVVLWDKLLVLAAGILFLVAQRWEAAGRWGRWVGILVVVLASAGSVFDDVHAGDIDFAPVYPTLFALVATGTLPLRPLQTLAMTVCVSVALFLGEALLVPGGSTAALGVIPEQIPFMFVVTVVLTGISMLLFVTRYEQYRARAVAESLQKRVTDYARDLEDHAVLLEDEKRRTEEHARKVVELERLKDRFFANISHEFRTPLTLIMGPADDAIEGEYGSISDGVKSQFALIRSSAQRLLRLVNDLLDLSKLDAGAVKLHPRDVDVAEFLTPIVGSFSDLARRKGLKLLHESDISSLQASFDPDAIEKVVFNLISNALKFTPAGGSVRVKLTTESGDDGEQFCISVRDTGSGIESDQLQHIFDRFHQVESDDSRPHEGTGLGLALVRELVELHGGRASVDSEPGFGSEFVIRIPTGHRVASPVMSRSGALEVVDLTASAPQLDTAGETGQGAPSFAPLVLVVDNDEGIRGYVRSHLRSHYRVDESADGVEALEKMRAEKPALVICDVMMPRMDGFEFCRRVRNDPDLADVPIVLLTARADEESRLEGLRLGADDYMPKPFSSTELLARVENLIELRRMLKLRATGVGVEPSPVDVQSVDQVFLDRVKEIVEAHIQDSNFGVDWLADEVALSPRQLQRRMRKLTRLSAAGYIRLMRLKRAEQLLVKRAGNVSEVAYAVGFRDAAHFSKLFRQTFGVLPSEVTAEDDVPAVRD